MSIELTPTEHLRAVIAAEGGSISVERFMREALYHPRFGYYARRVGTVGRTGDFSTSATLYPILGEAIAAWARQGRAEVTRRGRWHLIELGGGTGELAETVLRSLGWWGRRGLHYHLVEVSAPLREQQQRRLGTLGNVVWHEDMAGALEASAGWALIFSNEFVDAFPCRQFVRAAGSAEWREVCIAWPDGSEGLVEATVAVLPEALPSVVTHLPAGTAQRVEAHPAYQGWLASWAGQWRAGRMLTVDYGDRADGLYHRQPRGTLRAYCRHQRFEGEEVYRRFGQQDLTADVNFSDLEAWGKALDMELVGLQTQSEFLRRWLSARQLTAVETTDARAAFLLNPAGAGGAFKVLEQVKRPR